MKSDRSAGLALASAIFGGAFSGWAFWFFLNKTAVINGRGLLARAGWPLGTAILFAVVGAVIGVLAMIRSNRRSRSLREQLREVAGTLRLTYEEGEVDVSSESRPGAPLFEHWRRCENRLSGPNDGVAATMFDLATIRKTDDGTTHQQWTVVVFPKTHLPAFVCIPKSWSTLPERATLSSLSFDTEAADPLTRTAVDDFQKAYQLGLRETATRFDEDDVRHLFCAPRLEALAVQRAWHVQSADGFLVFARKGTAPAADRSVLWQEAAELRRALLAPVSDAATVIPAAPGMDLGRQRNRLIGRRAGGLGGAVVGFFGSFIAFATVMASRMGPHAGGLRQPGAPRWFFAFCGVLFGGLVIGGIVGSWLGGRIADRFCRPTPEGTPALRISKGWVVVGAILGWVIGGAIGMGLTMVVTRQIQAYWVVPITLFSPPVLCLVVGGFAGYRVACERAVRRTGA
jgi:hypothetical protein